MKGNIIAANLDGSHIIQITHKHPDLSHRIRTDLDPEELVLASYPIALANKIIPFLEPQGSTEKVHEASSSPPSPSQSPSRCQSVLGDSLLSPPLSQASTAVLRSAHRHIALATAQIKQPNADPLSKRIHFAQATHEHLSTPTRQLLPAPSLSPGKGATYTSRTMTPNGTFSSPLKDCDITPSRILFACPLDTRDIPSAIFSPPHPKPFPEALPQSRLRRGPGRKGPPPITEFDPTPRIVEFNLPKPTLMLRHNVATSALRDVFLWARRCAEEGRIVGLQGWLIHFRDVTRLRQIREVCLTLKLTRFVMECEKSLSRWENGDWDDLRGHTENEFDRVLRAVELAEEQGDLGFFQDVRHDVFASEA